MRNHIGKHYIQGQFEADSHRCGFCGRVGCDIKLTQIGSVENGTIHPESTCKYYYKFSYKSKAKIIKSYPCTNKPVSCDQCKGVFWSYNLEEHYQRSHSGLLCPEMITDEERRLLLTKKF